MQENRQACAAGRDSVLARRVTVLSLRKHPGIAMILISLRAGRDDNSQSYGRRAWKPVAVHRRRRSRSEE